MFFLILEKKGALGRKPLGWVQSLRMITIKYFVLIPCVLPNIPALLPPYQMSQEV